MFILDPTLAKHSHPITELSLSKLLLSDNAYYPWVILVPKCPNISELIELTQEEQYQLMDEIAHVATYMKEVFAPDKLNICQLGNHVRQLHIHIIARYHMDHAWPNPVFEHGTTPYDSIALEERLGQLKGLSAA